MANNLIDEVDWDSLLDTNDIDHAWNNWKEKFISIMSVSTPMSNLSSNRNNLHTSIVQSTILYDIDYTHLLYRVHFYFSYSKC